MDPHRLTRLMNNAIAGMAATLDSDMIAGGLTATTFATNGSTASDVTIDDLLATAADIRRRYDRLPIGVRASWGALAAIRAAADEVRVEADPFGIHPRSFFGLAIVFDPGLTSGDWKFFHSWDEITPDMHAEFAP